jgi:methanogenic corrinoid protein MtbC1
MFSQADVDGDIENAEALASQAAEHGLDTHACIRQALAMGIQRVGSLVAEGIFLLPEIFKCADAVETAFHVLEPAQTGDQKRDLFGWIVLRPMEAGQNEIGRILHGTMLTQDLTDAQNIPYLQWLS